MKKIIIVIIISFLIAGCSDYKELDEIAIVEAMGIEKKEDKFLITVQIINTDVLKKDSSVSEAKTFIYSDTGSTIFEAIRNMSNKTSKKLFFPHLKILIIDDEIFPDTKGVIDLITRDTESMMNFDVVTTINYSPNEILKTISPLVPSSSESISKMLELSEQNNGNAYILKFEDFLKDIVSNGITPVFSNISLNKNLSDKNNMDLLKNSSINSYIEIDNTITYKSNGEIITLNKNQTKGLNYIRNKIKYSLITLPCKDNYYSMETFSSSTKLKENLKNNEIIINVNTTLAIGEFNCDLNIEKDSTLKMIKSDSEKMIESYINSAFDLAKQEETDFLGIGNFIYKNKYKYFDFKNKSWDKEGLSKINIKVKVDANVIKQGNLKTSIKDNDYEKR